MDFLRSLHSEVNEEFVSNPYPRMNEQIVVRLRMLQDNRVKMVFLRYIKDGGSEQVQMSRESSEGAYTIYRACLIMTQAQIHYHFIMITDDGFIYYTREGTTTYPPTEDHDFVVLADFQNPEWVPGSVFYQIYPDRFHNGNPQNAVKEDEYAFDGAKTKHLEWSRKPLSYAEGHCLDFYGGDLQGIIDKIPYLKELGVTAIYINPIFKSKTVHRYDCSDYFHVDPHLGGDEALINLTDALHRNGMRLIVDVSINHTGIDHPWFHKAHKDKDSEEHGYYYFDAGGNPRFWFQVPTLPQLNYNSRPLRKLIYEGKDSLIRHYLRAPFNIDGWRFDVGNNTGRNGTDQLGDTIFKGVRESAKKENPSAYLIGEHWKDNISYLQGDQWDGAMNYFASSRPLRTFAGEPDRFFFWVAGSGLPYRPTTAEELSRQILQHFSRIPNQLAFLQFNLLDSHDFHRFHNHTRVFDESIYRGLLIILSLLPGTFSIYYGDEIGLAGGMDTIEECRHPMEWNESKWDKSRLEFYHKLSHFKKSEKALHTGSYRTLYADNDTFVYARFLKKDVVLGILSKSPSPKTIHIPLEATALPDDTYFRDLFSPKEFLSHLGMLEVHLEAKEALLLKSNI